MKHALVALVFLTLGLSVMSCASAAAPTPAPPFLRQSPGEAYQPLPAATAAPVPTSAPALGLGSRAGTDSTSSVPSPASAERMIVYTVNLSLEVQDADKAVSTITNIVSGLNGYVAGANLSRDAKGRMRGTITVRVPAESLDAAQTQIEAVGLQVLSRNRNSNDVTDQYTDLNARLTNLTATENELRQLLDTVRERTGKAEDILAVYNRLTEIRGEIEQIKGQMNVLSKTSAMATMTINLTPHEEVQVVEPGGWVPNQTAREALRLLVQALQALGDVAIWFILFVLPLFVVLVLPIVIVAVVVRAIVMRRGRKKALTTA